MQIRDFILLAYKAFSDKIDGKTVLQKRAYFLGIMTGFIEQLDFKAHYYGPYSASVAHANDELQALGYLATKVQRLGIQSEDGREMVRHDFELTPEGSEIAKLKSLKFQEKWKEISDAAESMKKAGNLNSLQYSIAAKAYFLLREQGGGKASLKDIQEKARTFKWEVSEAKLEDAATFLEKIKLVSKIG